MPRGYAIVYSRLPDSVYRLDYKLITMWELVLPISNCVYHDLVITIWNTSSHFNRYFYSEGFTLLIIVDVFQCIAL